LLELLFQYNFYPHSYDRFHVDTTTAITVAAFTTRESQGEKKEKHVNT